MQREVSAAVWLTGLSGAGKTTLAHALARALRARGQAVCVVDGDALRAGLCHDLGFTLADRRENVRRAREVAKLLLASGVVPIVALISPTRAERDAARDAIGGGARFVEVHVATPLAVCEARDPKGLYRRARAGEIALMTGIDSPYEAPLRPEVVVTTDGVDVADNVARILAAM